MCRTAHPGVRGHHASRRWAVLGATLFALFAASANASSAQAASPEWKLTVTPDVTYFAPGPTGAGTGDVYTIEAENTGEASTSGNAVLEDVLPAGLNAREVKSFDPKGNNFLCPSKLRCESSVSAEPGKKLVMQIRVGVPTEGQGSEGPIEDRARVSGGGATAVEATASNEVNPEPPFGLQGFAAALTDSSKTTPYTQAGGHPYQFATDITFATRPDPSQVSNNNLWGEGGAEPVHDPRDVGAELPPGLIGNPQAVPRCELAVFSANECPLSTVVGTVGVRDGGHYQEALRYITPLYNLQPAGAYPGELGYQIAGIDFLLTATLRSGSDYGLTITNVGTAEVALNRARVTTWGVPAAASHDAIRGKYCFTGKGFYSIEEAEHRCETELGFGGAPGGPAGVPETPFLTMPTACTGAALTIGARADNWQVPGEEAKASATFHPVDGCNQLKFEPEIEARPTTDLADAPSGFEFNLKVPQNNAGPDGKEDPNGVATADLKEAVVKLPPGLVVNPSSGAGLEGCSPQQVGLTTPLSTTPAHFTEEPEHCPDASKLGTVIVHTQLLHNPLEGAVYLATPHRNPSGSLLAGYIVLEGEGIVVKLAGQFHTDPATGQITASFLENPQTPFEEFKFHFFEGARGALRTPAVCGSYETTATLTPYSHLEGEGEQEATPIAHPGTTFQTSAAENGGACPSATSEEPDKPVLHAGTESPQAGAYSPFSLKLVRSDGEQEIKAIDTTLPPGLTGKLAGIAECPAADLEAAAKKTGAEEQANPSCPLASEVGTVEVASGAGPDPLNVSGRAYLSGPYKSAPLSLAIVTPALAGPFDLGTVVVKTALYVNPETAQITAKSDPIPTILEGIPLDVRSVTLKMTRPDFTLNPTDCEPLAFTGSALSVFGQSAPLAQRFQVGGCSALPFKPKLALSLKGKTTRAGNPALKAVLTMKPGEANVAAAQVTLPHAEFLDNAHIGTVCTKPVFAEGAALGEKCPPQSIYGFARAETPLLDHPLEGPVYLRSPLPGHKLPDLTAALNGQIDVALIGKVDTGKGGGIRNTFEVVPDAPVSRFTLEMKGGGKGLLENSENICAKPQKAIADFTAQNGKVDDFNPLIANSCKGKKRGRHGGKR